MSPTIVPFTNAGRDTVHSYGAHKERAGPYTCPLAGSEAVLCAHHFSACYKQADSLPWVVHLCLGEGCDAITSNPQCTCAFPPAARVIVRFVTITPSSDLFELKVVIGQVPVEQNIRSDECTSDTSFLQKKHPIGGPISPPVFLRTHVE
ncbi:hypothetical protein Bbelb_090870 [Branchiostoma belcheri]|nr:hypothetical protein Bbelb_090870 [Branchiostoma belcheri]